MTGKPKFGKLLLLQSIDTSIQKQKDRERLATRSSEFLHTNEPATHFETRLAEYKSGDVDVNHNSQNINDASYEGITHHGGIKPQSFEQNWQGSTAQTTANND